MTDLRISSAAQLAEAAEEARRHYEAGRHAEAAALFVACLRVAPNQPMLWSHLGSVLRRQGHALASAAAHRRALHLDPGSATIRAHLANALCDAGHFAEALDLRQGLLAEDPDSQLRIGQVAEALHCDRRQAEAVALLDATAARMTLDPKLALQRAVAHLALGHWETGFAQFEARFALDTYVPDDRIRWQKWRGEDLRDKSIVILNEQGFGDAIFSARFLAPLRARGARVTVVTSPPMHRLLGQCPDIDEARPRVDRHDRFDLYSYAMSLPHRLGTTAATIPPPARFAIPEDSRRRARAIVRPFRAAFRIGVCWTGSTQNPINAARSMAPDRLLPLSGIANVQLFSLYKGPEAEQLRQTGAAGLIVDACSGDRDFADTAGVIEAMDMVVTTDTAVAHLAATLGKPTWVMLSRQGFWYWGYGETTPWYPSVRLYHQTVQGRWEDVLDRVCGDLRRLLGA